MARRAIVVAGVLLACRGDAPTVVPVTVDLDGAWALVSEDDDEIAVRFGQTGEGARVWARGSAGRPAGVTPVHDGRTLEVPDEGVAWPLVAFPEGVRRVEVTVQGIDLVVRAYGAPIVEVTRRDDAPDDPVITWVRLRPRPEDWRIVLDGLGTVSLPAPAGPVEPSEGGFAWTIGGPRGPVVLDTNAPAWSSAVTRERWHLDLWPSLWETQPYPRTGLTWTPTP